MLYRDLLIGVTRFFRDEEAFDVLEQQVLPELLQREPRDAPLRVWVAGCATGEEAYSLAILLHELMREARRAAGEDLRDRRAPRLARARDARASTTRRRSPNVSPERLARYFTQRRRRATRSCPSCARWSCSRSTT